MLYILGILFLLGYILITLESIIKVDKSAIAITLSMLLWFILMLNVDKFPIISETVWFKDYCNAHSDSSITEDDCKFTFIKNIILKENLGDVSEIFFFLFCAMSIVEMIDINGGFTIITNSITTGNKIKLLWILSIFSFFLSSIIDNMTTSIVMVSLLNKLIKEKEDLMYFSSVIVISSNSGGVWSPMGDVTSILLWSQDAITTLKLISYVFLPGMISLLVPLLFVTLRIRKSIKTQNKEAEIADQHIKSNYILPQKPKIEVSPQELSVNPVIVSGKANVIYPIKDKTRRIIFLVLGIISIIMIPILREITQIPPFGNAILIFGFLWILTDLLYIKNKRMYKFTDIIPRLDISTLLFFLGILMSVDALQVSGVMNGLAIFLKDHLGDIYVINIIIGFVSSIIDNVPLVAAALDIYPIVSPDVINNLGDFSANFVPDGKFWLLLNYCAGVWGSIFIIGSTAGVVVMGIQKINFIWYLKNITLFTIVGYLAGFFFLLMEIQFFDK